MAVPVFAHLETPMTLRATINLPTAAARTWDVTVVGAGPAGSLAAKQLAQLGNRVLLVDKAAFPRGKVCGCCLNHNSQTSLQAAGLGDLVSDLGAVSIHHLRIGAGSRYAELPLGGTVSLSRQAFDAALVTAAIAAGADFLPQTEARLGATTFGRRTLKLRHPEHRGELQTRVLLAADGVGSGLMKGTDGVGSSIQEHSRLGAGVVIDRDVAGYRRGTIYMACGRHGYVGLVRLEDNRMDMAAALDLKPLKEAGGMGALATRIISDAHFPEVPGLAQLKWQGTPFLTRRAGRVYADNALLIGDAAGYVEPFTGEGMAWALASGLAVVPIAHRAIHGWSPALGEEWSRVHRRVVRRRQWLCHTLARGLRHPRLTCGVVRFVSRFPVLARPFTRALSSRADVPTNISTLIR